MKDLESLVPVRTGSWLYAGSVPCEIRVVRHLTLYGTGDYEDPPEEADDREVECFYILYHRPVSEPEWVGGGAALTLGEAVAIVERTCGPGVVWHS